MKPQRPPVRFTCPVQKWPKIGLAQAGMWAYISAGEVGVCHALDTCVEPLGLLAGCAAAGTKMSEQQAESFKVGSSTYNDVVATFGAPTTTTLNPDGTRIAAYNYDTVRAQPQNFIPIINRFAADYDKETSSVVFTFDRSGVLTGTTSTQSGAGEGANLAAGSNAANRPYQTVK